jgi:5-aminopentanamidase
VRIACCQIAPVVGDLEANRRRARAAVRDAVAAGARLVVLPELCTSGYVLRSPGEARSLSQAAHGGALDEWSAEARAGDAIVVGGFSELGDDGELYNSAAMVDGTGVLAVYRKIHLWDREKLFFRPGSEAPPVVDTRLGRIGVVVCYDTSFPELIRAVALRGADVIAVPTNNPVFPRPDDQEPQEVVAVRAHAGFSRVFIAFCDRWGAERGVEFLGGSVITDADGFRSTELALGAEAALVADCDVEQARDKRFGERNDVFGDRRPELYDATDPTN